MESNIPDHDPRSVEEELARLAESASIRTEREYIAQSMARDMLGLLAPEDPDTDENLNAAHALGLIAAYLANLELTVNDPGVKHEKQREFLVSLVASETPERVMDTLMRYRGMEPLSEDEWRRVAELRREIQAREEALAPIADAVVEAAFEAGLITDDGEVDVIVSQFLSSFAHSLYEAETDEQNAPLARQNLIDRYESLVDEHQLTPELKQIVRDLANRI